MDNLDVPLRVIVWRGASISRPRRSWLSWFGVNSVCRRPSEQRVLAATRGDTMGGSAVGTCVCQMHDGEGEAITVPSFSCTVGNIWKLCAMCDAGIWTEGIFLGRCPMRLLWLVGQVRFFCQVNYQAATSHLFFFRFRSFTQVYSQLREVSRVDGVNSIIATTAGFIITCTHLQLHWDQYVGLLDENFWA